MAEKVKGTTCFLLLTVLFIFVGTGISFAIDNMPPSPPQSLTVGSEPPPPPPPPPPPGNDSLLSGMTPGNINIPPGWSILRVQDFESGCSDYAEDCGGFSGGITSSRPHTGNMSIEGTYSKDQSDVHWELAEGHTGAFSEIYISWYEYIDSHALFNDEFFEGLYKKSFGGDFFTLFLDWYWARDGNNNPAYNAPNATLYMIKETRGSYSSLPDERMAGKTDRVPTGSWVQWEVWIRPSTGPAPYNNGFFRVYLNGSLYLSKENYSVNGDVDLKDMSIRIGGVYTKLVWMNDYPSCSKPSGCSSVPGTGTDACTDAQGWWGQSFSSPVCNPVDPPLSNFKRYFDDIIILKR